MKKRLESWLTFTLFLIAAWLITGLILPSDRLP